MFNTSNTIRKVMIDRNMTITELSKKMDLSTPTLSKKINKPDGSYTIEYLQRIVSAMDCDITITISDKQTGKTLYTLTDTEEQEEYQRKELTSHDRI